MKTKGKKLIDLYNMMLKIRLFEEKVVDLYARGFIPGLAHIYIGEEAVACGACAALRKDDYITSTHRGHGHVIAKGADLKFMMAELLGKKTGYCKGKGASMHIADIKIGILGANGIAGGGLPIAVGSAWSAKWRRTDQVTVCFFGDGASNNGVFHESLNLASLHKLPVIFVCENNHYAIGTQQKRHQPITNISSRAKSYAMPGVTVDGNDVLSVSEKVTEAVKRARSKEGPTLIECKTYRWRGHTEGDPNQGKRYRSAEEIETWKKKDPIKKLGNRIIEDKSATKKKLDVLEKEILTEIEEAVNFAIESEQPVPEELYEDVYVQSSEAK